MYRKKWRILLPLLAILTLGLPCQLEAQLLLSGQIRTRSEYRDGQGSPLPQGSPAAFFLSQRSRLNLLFRNPRLRFALSLQDVRVWGQDASTINKSSVALNDGLMLHQAWIELLLSDTAHKNESLNLKIGRQELVYDNSRLLGNLDWLQQGRTHDAAVLKYYTSRWLLDLGAAFNQNKETSSGTLYNSIPPGPYPAGTNGGSMYKSLQFFHASRSLSGGKASFLLLADQFSRFGLDSAGKATVLQPGVWARYTAGFYLNQAFGNLQIESEAYAQAGHTPSGQKLDASLLSLAGHYSFSGRLSAGTGVDYTSGGHTKDRSLAFDPLYGTPHKFWGQMDYFYAASPFGPGGLVDTYIGGSYHTGKASVLNLQLHRFLSASPGYPASMYGTKRSLGSEVDINISCKLSPDATLSGGYSHFISTQLLVSPGFKSVSNAKTNNNWAFVMIDVHPRFLVQ